MRRLSTIAGLLLLVLVGSLLPASVVLAGEPSSVEVTGPATIEVGQDALLTATITPDGYDAEGATVDFIEAGGATGCTGVLAEISGITCNIVGLTAGTYTYHATYSGNAAIDGSSSADFEFTVTDPPPPPPDPGPSTTTLAGPGSVVVGSVVVLTATVGAPDGYDAGGATIDFNAITGGGPDCLDVAVVTIGTDCDLGILGVGTYVYEAAYSGNSTTLGSTSEQVTVVVTALPDTTLDASGVTRDYTKFYPVRDGYRDNLTMSGLRAEPIAVTIRIYSPTGKRVKTKGIALGSGPYSYAWSGRNSSGTILAAGKYKVVQTLADAAGNTLVVTQYTTLSKKRLVTKTKYVTKLGKSISAQSSVVLVSKTGYLKLDARSVVKNVGYQFTIPSAIRYKSLAFQIYAKGPKTSPASAIGMQNFAWCPYVAHQEWGIHCFDRVKTIGGSGTKWYSTSGSVSANRSGTRVRGVVSAADGIYYVYKARVKVVYQVLE
jgi:hypothetical protein